MDVHVFDGKLENVLLEHRSKLEEISNISHTTKVTSILSTKYKFSTQAMNVINLICRSTVENEEKTNLLNALDVLYLIITAELEDDFIKNLDEQLSDIASGACASGRTTRLMQLYLQYQDSKNMCPILIIDDGK